MNPLFNEFGNKPQGNNPLSNMFSKFQEFKNTFSGNPQEVVQQLLNSGKMTQGQFNQLSQMAEQFRAIFKV